eukprot:1002391-Karenia_brevis.AAC.1
MAVCVLKGAKLIFSVSFQFQRMIPAGTPINSEHRTVRIPNVPPPPPAPWGGREDRMGQRPRSVFDLYLRRGPPRL